MSGLALLVLGGACLYCARCTYIVSNDDSGWKDVPVWLAPWPQAWLHKGDEARIMTLDAAEAATAYWEAVRRNPLLVPVWLILVRLDEPVEPSSESSRLYDFVLDSVPPSTAWGWQAFLLAAEGQDERRLVNALDFVLTNLPGYREEAFAIALQLWGSWDAVLRKTPPRHGWAVADACMQSSAVDACVGVYEALAKKGSPDAGHQIRFAEYLLARKCWEDASRLWQDAHPAGAPLVHNGGFEAVLTGLGFDWKFAKTPGAEVGVERAEDGNGHVLAIRFEGTDNVSGSLLGQYVPVTPGMQYNLSYRVRSRDISTDQRPFVAVRGVDCPDFAGDAPMLRPSSDWTEETVSVPVPGECHLLRLEVRRNASMKLNNRIAGWLWLDDVALQAASSAP